MKKHLSLLMVLGCVIAGCADIRGVSAQLNPVEHNSTPQLITLSQDVHFAPAGTSEQTLRKGSTWRLTGRLTPGDVYKPDDTVLTLDSINIHEAYLVLSSGKLVGYYLPAEHSYIPETKPFNVPLQ